MDFQKLAKNGDFPPDKWSNKLCFFFKKKKKKAVGQSAVSIIKWIIANDIKTLPKLYLTSIHVYFNLSLQHAKIMFAYK